MSETNDFDIEEQKRKLASTYDRNRDPNAELAEKIEGTGIEPIEMYFAEMIESTSLAENTIQNKRRAFEQWREHMEREGRHPAFPNDSHVKSFIEYLRGERGNSPKTVKQKLAFINEAYNYWQAEGLFPHKQDYNPIDSEKQKADLSPKPEKDMPRIPLEEMREIVGGVNHRLHKAVVVLQLKLGLRAGELANMQLQDVNISHENIRENYPELGSHKRIQNRPNAVYIPPRASEGGREGNKSVEPRVLPLDDETRRVLVDYLLVRPAGNVEDNEGVPWILLTKSDNVKLPRARPARIWGEELPEKYEGNEEERKVRSHFGRHYFTSYWRVEKDLAKELIQYMRGDVLGGGGGDSIDYYLHTYYEDVEEIYRQNIYHLL